ncbi:MAG: YebC/PmpR family DNA-binding transcriptional regulator [Candidatus Omnitrophica bacterium]|nr:YebC/PmpR family DNA-binding transcriptional regulator [Candidatus Omnitrophota bacterium]
MSGHNKWASIKHKKAIVDAKRGKVFTKIIKEITVAARAGGGDPSTNPRLRVAISSAKGANMPADNIERAIKKGTGELEGVNYEEIAYEGYGNAGVAVLVHCLTDNKNRSSAEIRSIFTKAGGSMAGAGSVAWIFEKKGIITVDKSKSTEDQLMEVALSAGAEDLSTEDEKFQVTTAPGDFIEVKEALEKAGVELESAEVTMIPKNEVKVSSSDARSVLKLIETLEDHDDVQNVYANCDIPEDVLKELNS